MARKIPPRRVPRDRFVQRGGSSGGIFSGASVPGAHTHLEVDITDLDKYTQAAADAKFLMLDASNDPMTAQLEVPSILSDFVQFDLLYADGTAEGKLQWNSEDGTLEVGMPGGNVNLQIGQEQLIRSRNETGVTITNGTPVYMTGASGNKPLIAEADASAEVTSEVIGFATEDIDHNSNGFITVAGLVRDVNTSGMTAGDELYLSTTAGEFVNVRPTPPDFIVHIGHVIAVGVGNGVILAHIFDHTTLDHEVSDVLIAGATTGDVLQYGAGSVWEDKSLSEAGISATGHTHLEADITDLGDYLPLAAGSGNALTSALWISIGSPQLFLNETDGAADNKNWQFGAFGEALKLRLVDDAVVVTADVMVVERTGTTVDSVNFPASLQKGGSDVLTTAGSQTIVGSILQMEATTPRYRWNQTNAASNEKMWDFLATVGSLRLRTLTDAAAFGANVFQVDRTGTTVDLVTFSAPVEVGKFGANGTTPITKPAITGSRGGNAALASLLTELANYGLITDSSSA